MAAVFGAVLMGAVAILDLLAVFGLPLGDFLMGGNYKILPRKLKIAAGVSVAIQMIAILIILRTGGMSSAGGLFAVSRGFCFFFAVYFTVDVLFHLCSQSLWERLVMTSVSILTASCFWITALGA